MHNNLKYINKDELWLKNILKDNNKKLEDILLATIDENNKINFFDRNLNVEPLNALE